MAKMTIAQLREKEVERLAHYENGFFVEKDISAEDIDQAKHLLNRYYRLSALGVRNFEDDNDERRYNTRWHKENEEKEERWRKKLDADLFKVYGLNLTYSGLYPSISRKSKEGNGIEEVVIYGHFY